MIGKEGDFAVPEAETLATTYFTYSGISDLRIVNGFLCEDGSGVFAFANNNDSPSGFVVIKFDKVLHERIWERGYLEGIQRSSVDYSYEENQLVMAPNIGSLGYLIKLDMDTGDEVLYRGLDYKDGFDISVENQRDYVFVRARDDTTEFILRLDFDTLSIDNKVKIINQKTLGLRSIITNLSIRTLLLTIYPDDQSYQLALLETIGPGDMNQVVVKNLKFNDITTSIYGLIEPYGGRNIFMVLVRNSDSLRGYYVKSSDLELSGYVFTITDSGGLNRPLSANMENDHIIMTVSGGTSTKIYDYSLIDITTHNDMYATDNGRVQFARKFGSLTYFGGTKISDSKMFLSSKVDYLNDDNFKFTFTQATTDLIVGSPSDYSFDTDPNFYVTVVTLYQTTWLVVGADMDPGNLEKDNSYSLSPVIYTGEAQNHFNVMEKTERTIFAELPGTLVPTDTVNNKLIELQTNETSDWASLDLSTNSLRMNATDLRGENSHSFRVEYEHNNEELEQFEFNITVVDCEIT